MIETQIERAAKAAYLEMVHDRPGAPSWSALAPKIQDRIRDIVRAAVWAAESDERDLGLATVVQQGRRFYSANGGYPLEGATLAYKLCSHRPPLAL